MRSVNVALAVAFAAALLGCQAEPHKSAAGFRLPEGDAEQGREAFVELRCHACHEVEGLDLPRPVAAPEVDVALGGLARRAPTDGELVTAIINPSHQLIPGAEEQRVTSGGESRMANYGDVMTVGQLVDLVAFLRTLYSEVRPS